MSEIRSVQIILKHVIAEPVLLEVLGSVLGVGVASADMDDRLAPAVAQISVYSQGFQQGVLVSWPASVAPAVVGTEFARRIALKLSTEVLLEDELGGEEWLLVSPDGGSRRVAVNFLDDGIDLSKLRLLDAE